jgi:hypothetical protein
LKSLAQVFTTLVAAQNRLELIQVILHWLAVWAVAELVHLLVLVLLARQIQVAVAVAVAWHQQVAVRAVQE